MHPSGEDMFTQPQLASIMGHSQRCQRDQRLYVTAGQGSGQVSATALQLLEHSLLTELQGVVARTLQGVDMFTQAQLADILGHAHRSQPDQATLPTEPERLLL